LAALGAFAGSLAFTQFETAVVLGTVRDATGGAVAGCDLQLENVGKAVSVRNRTTEAGNFQFLDVQAGEYSLKAECKGFKAATTNPFTVAVSARQRVDLAMEVGDVAQSVTVAEAASRLETESSDRGQVIGSTQMVNLPLNGRAYADLALLVPGTRKSSLAARPRDGSFDVNGLRSAFNNFVMDGVDNNSYATSHQGNSNQIVQPPPDAVQEFRLQTDNYSAEYGRAAGAVVNASIRSGGNEVHGAAWEFLRNTSLNAVGFFQPVGGSKPVLIQNQFGGALGGPIRKNRIFLFGDYEGFRRVTAQVAFATVATLNQRNGIFTGPVKNPYTGTLYSDGVIPQSEITPFASKVLGDVPAPNLPGIANNFQWLPRSTNQTDKGDIRYDQYFGSRVTSFLRYSHSLANLTDPGTLPGNSGGYGIATRIYYSGIAGGATWTLSTTSLFEFRLGVTKTEGGKIPLGVGLPNMLTAYGIPGLPTDPSLVGGLNSQYITGYAKMGSDNSSPQYQNPTVIDPKLNYTRVLGRHTLKTGYEYQDVFTEVDDFHPKYGVDSYSGQFSRPSTVKSDSSYNIADFLFGARATYQLNNPNVAHLRQRMHFGYVQDDFKAFSKLTLNLGLRYEYATPQWERDNKQSNYDPATQSILQAKSGSLYDRALVNPDLKDFAPRVGLAYELGSKTAIRSGYGISYIHFNRSGAENLLAYNGPSVVQSTISQLPSQGLCTPGAVPSTCFRTTQMGYPAGFVDPSTFSPLLARVIYTPKDFRASYVQSWHLTIQQDLGKNWLLDVAYVGNHGVGLLEYGDLNQASPNQIGQTLTLQQRRPIQTFSYIQMAFNAGFSSYNGLQVKLEKRYANGFYFLNAFAWSKAIDNGTGNQEDGNNDKSNVNIYNLRQNRGISAYDQPLNNTTTVLWAVPFGPGHRYGSSSGAIVKSTLAGWSIAFINTMTSGVPINLVYSPSGIMTVSSFPSGDATIYRPNLTGDPMVPTSQRNIDHYFDPANVAIPTDVSQPFGNAGRNIGRGNAFYQLDLSAHKDFALPGEGKKIEFRTEWFNALNKTNFGPADGNRSNSSFGTVRTALQARQIQFAMKFVF
jgi:hypothetical protein